MANVVVVFDFDKTIIDCESDNWVIEEMGFVQTFDRLLSTMPWNSAMDGMMKELHSHGISIKQIENSLNKAPLHPEIVTAIKSAFELGCNLRIVSDANMFFIKTILKHHGLLEYFSEINSNPAFIDDQQNLKILPYHDFNSCSHDCNLCPPNMCKGIIIDRILTSFSFDQKRIIYLGDGSGDFCPSIKLRKGDFLMPRKNFPLGNLICKNRSLIKSEIHEWSIPEELHKTLIRLVNNIKTSINEEPEAKEPTISVSLSL